VTKFGKRFQIFLVPVYPGYEGSFKIRIICENLCNLRIELSADDADGKKTCLYLTSKIWQKISNLFGSGLSGLGRSDRKFNIICILKISVLN
jgi:hypothetical protein